MKTKLLMSLFVLMSLLFSAQNTDQKMISKSFSSFLETLKSKDIDKAVDNIYPKFFTFFPKDQMKMILNMTYNNPIMKVEIMNYKVTQVGSPELINGEYFSIVDYSTRIRCNAEGMQEEMRNKIKDVLVQKYGKGSVVYYPNEMAYYINAKTKACAISKDRKNWKYILVEREMKQQLNKILPKKILDKI
ncbi:hypothetical protein ASG31_04190 [Chryseobacterium sp. Leaf404]|uniref:hypothetical protein n=1 Tax=unclassified Chryseobacterium TaxID=2593645 RepID=UPI0006F504AE|nr:MULTISPECIES: hypothetical protein [unclassified Chryseobacterium]KQT18608.1 hypothetical protein ASG31_04190 [Chryseobacterium sp. Leaf404]